MKFLHTLGTNEKAKELLEQRKPANEEEKIEVYAEIATGLGEPTTAEDFREAVKEAEEQNAEAYFCDTGRYLLSLLSRASFAFNQNSFFVNVHELFQPLRLSVQKITFCFPSVMAMKIQFPASMQNSRLLFYSFSVIISSDLTDAVC